MLICSYRTEGITAREEGGGGVGVQKSKGDGGEGRGGKSV